MIAGLASSVCLPPCFASAPYACQPHMLFALGCSLASQTVLEFHAEHALQRAHFGFLRGGGTSYEAAAVDDAAGDAPGAGLRAGHQDRLGIKRLSGARSSSHEEQASTSEAPREQASSGKASGGEASSKEAPKEEVALANGIPPPGDRRVFIYAPAQVRCWHACTDSRPVGGGAVPRRRLAVTRAHVCAQLPT